MVRVFRNDLQMHFTYFLSIPAEVSEHIFCHKIHLVFFINKFKSKPRNKTRLLHRLRTWVWYHQVNLSKLFVYSGELHIFRNWVQLFERSGRPRMNIEQWPMILTCRWTFDWCGISLTSGCNLIKRGFNIDSVNSWPHDHQLSNSVQEKRKSISSAPQNKQPILSISLQMALLNSIKPTVFYTMFRHMSMSLSVLFVFVCVSLLQVSEI